MKSNKKQKKKSIEECVQKLLQAKADRNTTQIKIWQDIINKLESKNVKDTN